MSSGLALRPVTTTCRPVPARAQGSDHRVQVEILVAQRDIELVEDHQPECRVGHELERLCPGPLGGGDVALEVLGLPGKALAHGVPGHLVAERDESIALRGVPRALDELHDADPMATAEHAQREPEGGGGFALAGPGVDDEKPFLDRLAGDLGVLHRLALRHLGAMAFRLSLVDRFGHGLPFIDERQSGDDQDHAIRARGDPLVEQALQVAKAPRQRIVGHDSEADLVGDQHQRRRGMSQRAFKPRDLGIDVRVREQHIR